MSQPKRYSIRGFSAALVEEDNGVMVKWEDYAALKAEAVKQIEAAMPPIEAYIAKLEAENARLRKAGDDFKELCYLTGSERMLESEKRLLRELFQDWEAAKEVHS